LWLILFDLLFPGAHALLPIAVTVLESAFQLANPAEQVRQLHLLVWSINSNVRLMRRIQKRKQPVIFFLLERIKLVVMALRALDGNAEDTFANRIHAIEH